MRGNVSAPMVFKDVVLSQDRVLSEPGEGIEVLLKTVLSVINLGVASICLGIAEAAIEITKRHILKSELKHLSRRLADLPNERARLARYARATVKNYRRLFCLAFC